MEYKKICEYCKFNTAYKDKDDNDKYFCAIGLKQDEDEKCKYCYLFEDEDKKELGYKSIKRCIDINSYSYLKEYINKHSLDVLPKYIHVQEKIWDEIHHYDYTIERYILVDWNNLDKETLKLRKDFLAFLRDKGHTFTWEVINGKYNIVEEKSLNINIDDFLSKPTKAEFVDLLNGDWTSKYHQYQLCYDVYGGDKVYTFHYSYPYRRLADADIITLISEDEYNKAKEIPINTSNHKIAKLVWKLNGSIAFIGNNSDTAYIKDAIDYPKYFSHKSGSLIKLINH